MAVSRILKSIDKFWNKRNPGNNGADAVKLIQSLVSGAPEDKAILRERMRCNMSSVMYHTSYTEVQGQAVKFMIIFLSIPEALTVAFSQTAGMDYRPSVRIQKGNWVGVELEWDVDGKVVSGKISMVDAACNEQEDLATSIVRRDGTCAVSFSPSSMDTDQTFTYSNDAVSFPNLCLKSARIIATLAVAQEFACCVAHHRITPSPICIRRLAQFVMSYLACESNAGSIRSYEEAFEVMQEARVVAEALFDRATRSMPPCVLQSLDPELHTKSRKCMGYHVSRTMCKHDSCTSEFCAERELMAAAAAAKSVEEAERAAQVAAELLKAEIDAEEAARKQAQAARQEAARRARELRDAACRAALQARLQAEHRSRQCALEARMRNIDACRASSSTNSGRKRTKLGKCGMRVTDLLDRVTSEDHVTMPHKAVQQTVRWRAPRKSDTALDWLLGASFLIPVF